MLFGGRRKDREVQQLMIEYTELVGSTVTAFRTMVDDYLEWDKGFKKESLRIHQMETTADEIRRKVEMEMLSGALLPMFRADYIRLMEMLDRVANKAEEAADLLYLMRPDIPEVIRGDVGMIASLTLDAWKPLPGMIQRLLDDKGDLSEEAGRISAMEAEIDALQFQTIRRIYKECDLEKIEQLENKMLIDSLANVSDRIENVADQVALMAIKRRL